MLWYAGYVLHARILHPGHCHWQGSHSEFVRPLERPFCHQRFHCSHQVHTINESWPVTLRSHFVPPVPTCNYIYTYIQTSHSFHSCVLWYVAHLKFCRTLSRELTGSLCCSNITWWCQIMSLLHGKSEFHGDRGMCQPICSWCTLLKSISSHMVHWMVLQACTRQVVNAKRTSLSILLLFETSLPLHRNGSTVTQTTVLLSLPHAIYSLCDDQDSIAE